MQRRGGVASSEAVAVPALRPRKVASASRAGALPAAGRDGVCGAVCGRVWPRVEARKSKSRSSKGPRRGGRRGADRVDLGSETALATRLASAAVTACAAVDGGTTTDLRPPAPATMSTHSNDIT